MYNIQLTTYVLRITSHDFTESNMKTHKDLDVWNKSIDLVEDIYKLTKEFPKEELYGLTNQLRRASVSISSNIAEGAARNSNKEFIQFLYVALGSLSEVETQLIIAVRLKFISGYNEEQITNLKRMLLGLIRYVKS